MSSPLAQVLSRRRRGRAWVVRLGGNLNERTRPPVKEAIDDLLNKAGQQALMVGATAVQSADSAVIDLLLALQKEATLVIPAPSRLLQNPFSTAPVAVPSSPSLGEALDLVGT